MLFWQSSMWVLAGVVTGALLVFGIGVYGYAHLQKNIPLPPRVIALTFDDGPVEATSRLLDMLQETDVHATFLIIGQEAEKRPDILKRIVAEGHVIGNHTQTHPHYIGLRSRGFALHEMTAANEAIERVTGTPVRFFRAPFGETSMYSDWLARSIGMTPVLWTLSTKDWKAETTPEVLDVTLGAITKSQVILMHDRAYASPKHMEVLKKNILRLRAEGYTFVTIDQLKL